MHHKAARERPIDHCCLIVSTCGTLPPCVADCDQTSDVPICQTATATLACQRLSDIVSCLGASHHALIDVSGRVQHLQVSSLWHTDLCVLTDNTNADIETRAYWVKLAQEFKVPIRLVRFTASSRLAEHNDAVRAMNLTTVRSCR